MSGNYFCFIRMICPVSGLSLFCAAFPLLETFYIGSGNAGFPRFRVFVSLILLYGNLGDMVFHALVKAHLFRRNLQLFRMIHEMNRLATGLDNALVDEEAFMRIELSDVQI